MSKVTGISATMRQKETAVMKSGKRSAEKLIEILKTFSGSVHDELVRKILRSILNLGSRVYLDECHVLDASTLKHVVNVIRAVAVRRIDFQIWLCVSGHEFWIRSEPFENDRL